MMVVLPPLLRLLLPAGLADRARRLVWRLPNLVWTLPSGLRLEVRSPADWVLYNDLFVGGEYDGALDLLVELSRGRERIEILDLGANVGYFSLLAADRLLTAGQEDFRLTLVEAGPRLAGELERRLAPQPALAGKLRLHHGLVGRRSGVGTLYERTAHFENTTRPGGGRPRRVPYLDLDGLFPPGTRIDLLKCDIEGAEEEFLATYAELLGRVELAAIEIHTDRCDLDRCCALLADAGLIERRVLRDYAHTRLLLLSR